MTTEAAVPRTRPALRSIGRWGHGLRWWLLVAVLVGCWLELQLAVVLGAVDSEYRWLAVRDCRYGLWPTGAVVLWSALATLGGWRRSTTWAVSASAAVWVAWWSLSAFPDHDRGFDLMDRWLGHLGPGWVYLIRDWAGESLHARPVTDWTSWATRVFDAVLLVVVSVALARLMSRLLPRERVVQAVETAETGSVDRRQAVVAVATAAALALVVLATAAWIGVEGGDSATLTQQGALRLPAVLAVLPWVVRGLRSGRRMPMWVPLVAMAGHVMNLEQSHLMEQIDDATLVWSTALTGVLLAAVVSPPALVRLLDRCVRHPRTTLAWLLLANVADAAATAYYLHAGVATEGNAVIRAVGLPAKVAVVSLGAVLLARFAPRWLGPCALVLSVVLVWHAVGGALSLG